ncbi:MAG: hypothetical protein ABSA29_05440 [Terriglobales bacterium]|jgi:hypothetical protein
MKVLLLHPDEALGEARAANHWDLVVDLGRAPIATYDRRSRQAGCPVVSIYDYAVEIDDLYRLRELLQIGTGLTVDSCGIDWWDVLSLELVPQLQQLMLACRLARELGASCELYASRSHFLATALQRLLGVRLKILENRVHAVTRQARHYRDAFALLDAPNLTQVFVDKFDSNHSIRRRFARRRHTSGEPVVLLPSAYINVSRVVLLYSRLLPDHKFLLVWARRNAKVPELPDNVRTTPLTPYFVPNHERETNYLLKSWSVLRKHLACNDEIFDLADAIGLLGEVPSLLRWGLSLRNAWSQVFESENVTACISGDDSNPPSSIPLMMARKRGLPAIACHHGALNSHMAIKSNHADVYLVKNEMERDYLRRVCKVPAHKTLIVARPTSKPLPAQRVTLPSAPWLVFFTEPYLSSGWRSDEVYRDLLPRLCALAQACGLRLVFKLHPFDSIKGHRKMLRRFVPEYEYQIEVFAGPPADRLWINTRLALTVQSSTALQCTTLGIPVFLCAWLRDPYSGYVQQYQRFGVGHVLESPEQIADIPRLLEKQEATESGMDGASTKGGDAEKLARLFSPVHTLAAARG